MKAIILIVFGLMTLFVIAWFFAAFKHKRWNQNYIYLRNLIRNAEVNEESYNMLYQELDALRWNNEYEHNLYKYLWMDVEWKFRKLLKYKDKII